MLHPVLNGGGDEAGWADALADFHPGGVFFFFGKTEQFRKAAVWLQHHSSVPAIVSSDFENGACRMFQAAIYAGALTIMTGHIACPALDPGDETDELNCRHRARPSGANVCEKEPKHPSIQTSHHCHEDRGGGNTFQNRDELGAPPATLSHTLTTGILREKKRGVDGLVITDAIGMGGITSRAGSREKIIRTIEAGSDMILFCDLPETRAALQDGLTDDAYNVDGFDELARKEGWRITRIDENHRDQAPPPTDFDHILVLSVFGPQLGRRPYLLGRQAHARVHELFQQRARTNHRRFLRQPISHL